MAEKPIFRCSICGCDSGAQTTHAELRECVRCLATLLRQLLADRGTRDPARNY